jgi:hypothetical protein
MAVPPGVFALAATLRRGTIERKYDAAATARRLAVSGTAAYATRRADIAAHPWQIESRCANFLP